jgi:Ca2+-transporting ATPase
MTVTEVWAGGRSYKVSGTGYDPSGGVEGPAAEENAALMACFRAGALCNDAALSLDAGVWRVEGDPTEGALIVSAHKAGFDTDTLQREWPRVDAIPFESQHQYMGTLHHSVDEEFAMVCLKGSVEALLERCGSVMSAEGEHLDLDAQSVHEQVARMAESGCRVLAFAEHRMSRNRVELTHDDVRSRLVLLGLQAMIDPPRPEALPAVAACRRAGILVKMITGDHATTAAAIAQQIGIAGGEAKSEPEPPRVLTGQQVAQYTDDELLGVSQATDVFARTTPEQKLRLVRLFQRHGHVVAMTGDGVNDAPALEQADIGVAMGARGTEVAKEASDMVLTDDNFASIEAAVEEGRGVFANIIKFITWTLPTNVAEALIVLVAVAAGTALPIEPVQILWINMATALCLGMTLAFEPREQDIMRRPPRDPRAPIIGPELAGRIVLVGFMLLAGSFGLFRWARQSGMDVATAQTIAANTLVMGELFYLFNCRSLTRSIFRVGVLSNAWLLLGVASMIGLQLLFTYASVMHGWFGTSAIGWDAWSRILLVSAVIYATVGLEKWVRNKRNQHGD